MRMDDRILSSLDDLHNNFLSVLADASTASGLLAFTDSWISFTDSLAPIHNHLLPETRREITIFADLVNSVAVSAIEAEDACSEKIAQLSQTIPQAFGQVSLASGRVPIHGRRPSASQGPSALPKYFEPALRWIKANIYNPYPSQVVRKAIARETQSSLKDVDAWFIDFRKRIGWSSLRNARFKNRKADIVDAATRFFTNADPHRPLEGIVESEFASIAATVDQLYTEKCAGSTLAYRLDEAVKDLTPGLRVSLSKQKRRVVSESRSSKPSPRRLRPYPTPELSPTPPPRSPCTPELPSLDLSASNLSDNRKKRSRSPSTECPTDIEGDQIRPMKRKRQVSQQPGHYNAANASIGLDFAELVAEASVFTGLEAGHSAKRKRRPSDSGVPRAPPSREPLSQSSTPSTPLPLGADDVLDQAVFRPPSNTPANETSPCDSFGSFDPFFSAFMHGGTPVGGTSSPLPLFNIVDDTVPTNILVEFDPSWLNCSVGALATSSAGPSTGYNINFDDFSSNMYSGSLDPFSNSLWYGAQQAPSLASASYSGSGAPTLTSQLNLSPPSPPSGVYNIASPPSPSPNNSPSNLLTDKARELLELEARCAALRNELAGAC